MELPEVALQSDVGIGLPAYQVETDDVLLIGAAKRVIEPWQIAESTWLLRSGFIDVR